MAEHSPPPIRAMIVCHRDAGGLGLPCEVLQTDLDAPEDLVGWVRRAVTKEGWSVDGTRFFCPLHDPADVGELVALGFEYREIAPGVLARLPFTPGVAFGQIEVRLASAGELA